MSDVSLIRLYSLYFYSFHLIIDFQKIVLASFKLPIGNSIKADAKSTHQLPRPRT